MSLPPSPPAVHPVAAMVLAHLVSAAKSVVTAVPPKWRPLLSRYYQRTASWTLTDDGAYALLVDDWDCLHVYSFGCAAAEDCTGSFVAPDIIVTISTAGLQAIEICCSVSDAVVPAMLRFMLSIGKTVGHVERCQVWKCLSFPSTPDTGAHISDADFVRRVAPSGDDADAILTHW